MALETMNVSLPAVLKRFVERRVRDDGYGNTSEYVRELIRRDQEAREALEARRAILERHLLAGLDSGSSEAFGPEEWPGFEAELLREIDAIEAQQIGPG